MAKKVSRQSRREEIFSRVNCLFEKANVSTCLDGNFYENSRYLRLRNRFRFWWENGGKISSQSVAKFQRVAEFLAISFNQDSIQSLETSLSVPRPKHWILIDHEQILRGNIRIDTKKEENCRLRHDRRNLFFVKEAYRKKNLTRRDPSKEY